MTFLALALLLSQTQAPAPAPPAADDDEKATMREIRDAARRIAEAAERMSPPPPPPPPAALPAAPPAPPRPWTSNVTAGLTWVTGNVTSFAFVGNASTTRKVDRTILAAKAFAGYGEKLQDPAVGPNEVLLYNVGVTAQFDYRFTPLVSAFVGAGVDADHVKSVELRGYGDVGLGVLWLDSKEGPADKQYQKALLKTDLNVRVQPEARFQYYPVPMQVDDSLLVGPRLAAAFVYAVNATIHFHEDLEVLPNVLGEPRVLVNSLSKASVGLNTLLAFNASFALKFDSLPAAGKKPVDTILSLGLEANF